MRKKPPWFLRALPVEFLCSSETTLCLEHTSKRYLYNKGIFPNSMARLKKCQYNRISVCARAKQEEQEHLSVYRCPRKSHEVHAQHCYVSRHHLAHSTLGSDQFFHPTGSGPLHGAQDPKESGPTVSWCSGPSALSPTL